MAFASVSEWDVDAADNTEIDGISLAENVMRPPAVNNAFREMMSQIASYTRHGSDLSNSTGTLNLDSIDAMFLNITGTTTVTAATLTEGHSRRARAVSAFQLTASASLVVNGSTSSNYTTSAGDLLFFEGYGSSVVRVWSAGATSAATTSAAGIVRLADLATTLAGTNADRAVVPANLYFPTGHLYGLTLSNNGSDAVNDIDIAAGTARDGSDTVNMLLASALTKRLDASWTVGTNQGMLDGSESSAGTPDTSTWYHIWLIKRSDTGVVDVLASESATAPTMPSNYDYKRRIGAVYNNSSGDIRAFTQNGDEFLWNAAILDINANNPGISAVTRTLTVPTGVVVDAVVNWVANNAGTGVNFSTLVSSLAVSDQAPSVSAAPGVNLGGNVAASASATATASAQIRTRTNTSAQVRTRATGSDASCTLYGNTVGWFDSRGRLAA